MEKWGYEYISLSLSHTHIYFVHWKWNIFSLLSFIIFLCEEWLMTSLGLNQQLIDVLQRDTVSIFNMPKKLVSLEKRSNISLTHSLTHSHLHTLSFFYPFVLISCTFNLSSSLH
jgi:hypothetical protein